MPPRNELQKTVVLALVSACASILISAVANAVWIIPRATAAIAETRRQTEANAREIARLRTVIDGTDAHSRRDGLIARVNRIEDILDPAGKVIMR